MENGKKARRKLCKIMPEENMERIDQRRRGDRGHMDGDRWNASHAPCFIEESAKSAALSFSLIRSHVSNQIRCTA